MKFTVTTDTIKEFAQVFWQHTAGAKRYAFHGEMGAGKTTLISAICHAKGVKDITGSPTFSIINQYVFEEEGQEQKIYHMDLYRLRDEEEIRNAGVEDALYSGSICLVEWPEKAPDLFEEDTVHVYINPVSHSVREVTIGDPSDSLAEQS